MSKNKFEKPNKKVEIVGKVIALIGLAMILLRIFLISSTPLLVVGIILFFVGAIYNLVGMHGQDKAMEVMMAGEKMKAKAAAKGVKEALEESEDK